MRIGKNEIYICYGTDYLKMTKELLDRAELGSLIPDREALIAIKPNLLGPVPASEGATTHTEIVAGILEYLRGEGFTSLEIIEGSWVGDRTQDSIECCGYDELCRKYDVPFYDMQKDETVETDCGGMKIRVCRKALEADFLINVPVLKGHCQTKMTCALKNMKGVIPNAEKRRFHRMGLFDPIGHLSAGVHQDFIVVDSICGDPTFEDGGNPVQQDRIYVGRDPVLIDAYGAGLIGIPVSQVPYIGIAEKCGVGSADVKHAHIVDIRSGENATVRGETAKLRKSLSFMDKAEEIDSCSACFAALVPALQRLEAEGLLDRLNGKVCIGQGFRGKTGELGVGNCTSRFAHTLKGCPPDSEEMYKFLKDYLTG